MAPIDFFLFFNLQRLFAFYCLWFRTLGFMVRWIFFCFLTSSVFLHFIAFGLRPSGLGPIDFFFFFGFLRLFAFYCLWFKALGFRLQWIFLCFLTGSVFLHLIAFGLRPSGLGSDGFFLFFDFHRVFAFYCPWFKALGFRLP